MTPERWAGMKDVLDGALDLPEGQRGEYFDETCGSASELRPEIEVPDGRRRKWCCLRVRREKGNIQQSALLRGAADDAGAAPRMTGTFDGVFDLPEWRRGEHVNETCGSDAELRQEIEAPDGRRRERRGSER